MTTIKIETTDVGLAEVFVELIGGGIKYQDDQFGNTNLIIYDNNKWTIDKHSYRCKKRFIIIMLGFINEKITKTKQQVEVAPDHQYHELIKQLKLYEAVRTSIQSVSKQNSVLEVCKSLLIDDKDKLLFDTTRCEWYLPREKINKETKETKENK